MLLLTKPYIYIDYNKTIFIFIYVNNILTISLNSKIKRSIKE